MSWRRRILWGTAIVLGGFVLLFAFAFAALNIDGGRKALLAFAAPVLERSSGIGLEVGGTGGTWPHDILLTDVRLRDGSGEWLSLERLRLQWCLSCAVGGEIRVKTILVEGGLLSRTPEIATSGASEPEETAAPASGLPEIAIERAELSAFDIGPALVDGGTTLNASLVARTEGGTRIVAELRGDASAPGGDAGPAATWIGPDIAFEANAQYDTETAAASVERLLVSGARGRLTGQDLRYGPGDALGGRLSASVALPDTLPPTLVTASGGRVHLKADLSGRLSETVSIPGLTLESDEGAVLLSADASLHTVTTQPAVGATLALTPLLAQGLAPAWELQAPVAIVAEADDLTGAARIRLGIEADESLWNGNGLPAIAADLSVDDALANPQGVLNAIARQAGAEVGTAKAEFAMEGTERLRLSELDIRYADAAATGSADLTFAPFAAQADMTLSVPDLSALPQFAALSGDLSGSVVLDYGGEAGTVDARLRSNRLGVGTIAAADTRLRIQGPIDAAAFDIRARAVDGLGAGDFSEIVLGGVFGRSGETVHVDLRQLAADWSGAQIRLRQATRLEIAGADATLAPASLDWGQGGQLDLSGRMTGADLVADLAARRVLLPIADLEVDGTVRLETAAQTPGRFQVRVTPKGPEAPEALVDLGGVWNGTRVTLDGAVEGFGRLEEFGRHAILSGSVPLRLLPGNGTGLSLSAAGDADLRVAYAAEVEPLFALARLGDQTLTGALVLDLEIRGPLDELEAQGLLELENGAYEHLRAGTRLTDLVLTAEASGSAADPVFALSLSANDGSAGRAEAGPALSGRGRFERTEAGLTIDADLTLDRARMVRRDDFDGTFSGNAQLAGTLPSLALTGRLEVDALDAYLPNPPPGQAVDVEVVRVDRPSAPAEPPVEEPPVVIDLDLALVADGEVFIRGRGLDSEWTADVSVSGTSIDPRIRGPVAIKRGTFEFGGRVFDFERGRILFVPVQKTDPTLDVRTRAEIPSGETVFLSVSGRASEPSLSLSSNPSLPDEDVMSLILFGKPATKLSAFESLQVANAVATLTGTSPLGGTGPGVLDRARQALGLDQLQVGAGADGLSDAGLTVGKYVAEGVRVSASQDVSGSGGEVTVEVDVTDSISVETDVGQDASGSVSVFWSRDY